MHRTLLFITLSICLFAGSCDMNPEIRFGFDTLFGARSQGISIMNVSSKANGITLRGDVTVRNGAVLIELVSPAGEPLFTRTLHAPATMYLNESFPSSAGNWKLKYNSIDGTGSIKLHMTTGS